MTTTCIKASADGTRRYYNQLGALHRVNGPAVEYADGSNYWLQHGLLHRICGPAVTREDGSVGFYIFGQRYDNSEYFRRLIADGYSDF